MRIQRAFTQFTEHATLHDGPCSKVAALALKTRLMEHMELQLRFETDLHLAPHFGLFAVDLKDRDVSVAINFISWRMPNLA